VPGRIGPALWIIGAAFCWSLLGPVSRVAFEAGVEPLEVAFWRAALGAALFGIHAFALRAPLPQRKDLPVFGLFALVGGTLFFASYQFAVDSGGAALAAVLLYTAPAWVIVAAAIFLRERMTILRLASLVLALVGVSLIVLQGGEVRISIPSVVWGLLAGISYASYYLFGKHYFVRYRPELVYAIVFPIAAITLLPLVSFSEKNLAAWLSIASVVLVSTYAAYIFYGRGLKRMEAGKASLIATIEPVSATVIAYLWWSERFTLLGYAGALLVLLGVVLSLRRPPGHHSASVDRQDAPPS
jgi:drug/metabolite transporter, DME family